MWKMYSFFKITFHFYFFSFILSIFHIYKSRNLFEKAKRSGQEAELCLHSLENLRSLESDKTRKIRIK